MTSANETNHVVVAMENNVMKQNDSATNLRADNDSLQQQNNNLLRTQIEFYFSAQNLIRDGYMRNIMQTSFPPGSVPLAIIAGFPKIRSLCGPNPLDIRSILVNAMEGSEVVVSPDGQSFIPRSSLVQNANNETNMYVVPNAQFHQGPTHSQLAMPNAHPSENSSINNVVPELSNIKERMTVILRDLSADCDARVILNALSFENIQPKSVRPDVGDTWYVTFASEAEAISALSSCRGKDIEGIPIRARIKSEANFVTSSSSLSLGNMENAGKQSSKELPLTSGVDENPTANISANIRIGEAMPLPSQSPPMAAEHLQQSHGIPPYNGMAMNHQPFIPSHPHPIYFSQHGGGFYPPPHPVGFGGMAYPPPIIPPPPFHHHVHVHPHHQNQAYAQSMAGNHYFGEKGPPHTQYGVMHQRSANGAYILNGNGSGLRTQSGRRKSGGNKGSRSNNQNEIQFDSRQKSLGKTENSTIGLVDNAGNSAYAEEGQRHSLSYDSKEMKALRSLKNSGKIFDNKNISGNLDSYVNGYAKNKNGKQKNKKNKKRENGHQFNEQSQKRDEQILRNIEKKKMQQLSDLLDTSNFPALSLAPSQPAKNESVVSPDEGKSKLSSTGYAAALLNQKNNSDTRTTDTNIAKEEANIVPLAKNVAINLAKEEISLANHNYVKNPTLENTNAASDPFNEGSDDPIEPQTQLPTHELSSQEDLPQESLNCDEKDDHVKIDDTAEDQKNNELSSTQMSLNSNAKEESSWGSKRSFLDVVKRA